VKFFKTLKLVFKTRNLDPAVEPNEQRSANPKDIRREDVPPIKRMPSEYYEKERDW